MTLKQLLGRWTFSLWAVLALLLQVLTRASDLTYDQGIPGLILIIAWPLWAPMYWLPYRLIIFANSGLTFPGYEILGILLGLATCLVIDHLRFRRKRAVSQ